jgi:hypothetical protein
MAERTRESALPRQALTAADTASIAVAMTSNAVAAAAHARIGARARPCAGPDPEAAVCAPPAIRANCVSVACGLPPVVGSTSGTLHDAVGARASGSCRVSAAAAVHDGADQRRLALAREWLPVTISSIRAPNAKMSVRLSAS